MKHGEISPHCLDLIKRANVQEDVLKSVQNVLAWCRRNSWPHALVYTLKHPVTALAFGTALGWFTTTFVVKEEYLAIVAFMTIPILGFFADFNG